MPRPFVIYVDVDDTLVRSVGTKRVPMPRVIEHVRSLHDEGAQLFCWSTGGEAYARDCAAELGIEDCFDGFLPKPAVMIDDQRTVDWHRLLEVSPLEAAGKSLSDYREARR